MQIKIKKFIEHSQNESYFTVPFELPKNVESFTVTYSYMKASADFKHFNIVDIGINDNKGRFVGWAGSTRKSITVGENFSSDGFAILPIETGAWQILVGAYKICELGCEVEFTIDVKIKQPKWYFGDLHMHSTASDGNFQIAQLIEMAKEKNLDFVSITDHNAYTQNLNLPHFEDFALIRGVEWTHYKGHINFYGVTNPFKGSFVPKDSSEAVQILNHARQLGAAISANHPFDPGCPLVWDFEYDYDMVEVVNGPMRPCNVQALKYWDEMLKNGKKVVAVGGSDFHNTGGAVTMGSPTTAVFANSNCEHDLLDALKKGHCFVTDKKNGVTVSLNCEDKMQGDSVQLKGKHTVQIEATNVPKNAFLAVFTHLGEHSRVTAQQDNDSLRLSVEVDCEGYIRAVVASSAGIFMPLVPIAISNPIYFKK